MQEQWVQSWVGKIPWRRRQQYTQCSCLEDPVDGGAWRAIAHGVTEEGNMTYKLNDNNNNSIQYLNST